MISIVTYLWRGDTHRVYLPEHVNTLRNAFLRTLSRAHRFICVSDESQGLAGNVEWVQTPPEARALGEIKTVEAGRFPSCYRRLWSFSAGARELLGERIMVVDIDFLPIARFDHLFDRTEPFVGWRPRQCWGRADRIGGGIYLMDTGLFTRVFDDFAADPKHAQCEARRAGYRGSDQAWISYCLGGSVPVWRDCDGIYSIRDFHNGMDLPPLDACAIQFNGPSRLKPWNHPASWVRAHWI